MSPSEQAARDFADLIEPPSETGVRFACNRDRWAWEGARKGFLDGVALWHAGGELADIYKGKKGRIGTYMAKGFMWADSFLPAIDRTPRPKPVLSPEQLQREREWRDSFIRDAEDRE